MFSFGLASFFSVGALLKSSAGSTLSQLLYFPAKRGRKSNCFSSVYTVIHYSITRLEEQDVGWQ